MTPPPIPEPEVLIVSGPSGSGKSTLVQKLLELPWTMLSISVTTRKPRPSEVPGKWYDFVSEEEFQRRVQRGELLEHAIVFGKNNYGTPRKWLDKAAAEGKTLVLEIDVQGAAQVMQKLPYAASIFILPPSWRELEKRIRARGQDSEDEIRRRLQRAREEIEQFAGYNYVVVNDDLDRAGREVQAIAIAARCRSDRNRQRVQKILQS